MISPTLANVIVVVVTIVWVISFAVSIFSPIYKPDPQINVIFMGIVGGSLALKAKRKEDPPVGKQ
jgi:hypothetical protein